MTYVPLKNLPLRCLCIQYITDLNIILKELLYICTCMINMAGEVCLLIDAAKPAAWLTHLVTSLIGNVLLYMYICSFISIFYAFLFLNSWRKLS